MSKFEIKLPALGADMDSGKIMEWKVKTGDKIKKGDILAIVETSKSAIEIESWYEGTLMEFLIKEGDEVMVGTPIASIEVAQLPTNGSSVKEKEEDKETKGKMEEEISQSIDHHKVVIEQPLTQEKIKASPLMEKPAPDERIEEDFTKIRDAIAHIMAKSKKEIPHYYLEAQVDMQKSLNFLQKLNEGLPPEKKFIPTILFIKATALALREFPEFNGYWTDGRLKKNQNINIGVSISLHKGGLLAPSLIQVDQKNLKVLMEELRDLVQRARGGILKGREMTDSTITLTLLGDLGVEKVFGIIFPPQVALVGVGRVVEVPVVENGQIVAHPVVFLTLSADHRASDGHRGGRFLSRIKSFLLNPESLDQSVESRILKGEQECTRMK